MPNHHPYQKHSEEIHDNIQDYIELVNKLQRHTRCNFSYCFRVNGNGQQHCRFGYPKEITKDTYLCDNNGQSELVTARNNSYINPHD